MGAAELLRWQWEGYARYHRSRFNLLLHVLFVPVFILGNIAFIGALFKGSWVVAAVGLAAMFVSIALQGRGHRQESTPAAPFTNKWNAVSRIFLEQWVTFPRFVLSGG